MKYYSTNNRNNVVGFEQAVMNGLAPDGGLYMPELIPVLDANLFKSINDYSIDEIALEVIRNFSNDDLNESELQDIIDKSFTFAAPINYLDDSIAILELFHGPTLAFKDFGARFMARTMEKFVEKEGIELNILVATSGDTGSAVANGFYDTKGINVYVLYPSNKVSFIQEKQLTTLDKNITALEIDGTFDDCQRLVKQAFVDGELTDRLRLSSANSINIARLIPQSIYYFNAYRQLKDKSKKLVFSIPSGNLGNLTAGLFAYKMGLPVHKYIGATNSNDVFTNFINTGKFIPTESQKTYSNAMDVGNPSNLARINALYNDNIELIRDDIYSISHNDFNTIEGMKEVFDKFNYVIDPHGAVGYLAVKDYTDSNPDDYTSIILETAHPAKFKDIVENSLSIEVSIPERLSACLEKGKKSVQLSKDFNSLKEYLLSN